MVQLVGESDSKEKAVADSSAAQPKPEFKCPRCAKTFYSAPALCGHQNVNRLVKDPKKISPVLVAVLNNPLASDDKPELIPQAPKAAGPKMKKSKYPCGPELLPRDYHPYRRLHKKFIQVDLYKEEVNRYNNHKPEKKPDGTENLLRQLEQKEAEYDPYEMVVPEYNTLSQCLTMDLLVEWMPISGFRDEGHLRTSSRGKP
ncbi:hypothetical protein REPUB_Repub02eG0196100 [Reevesia pubescens]